jgi:small multidrug resistance family-3 protein
MFLIAAVMEVAGDASIRKGMGLRSPVIICLGAIALGCYGLVVNMVLRIDPEHWSFSRMLGVYVAFFVTISVFWDILFPDRTMPHLVWYYRVPCTTWIGMAIVIVGAMLIQYGPKLSARSN